MNCNHARRGMTLVELVVSLALVTIIVAASGSMIFVASKAISGEASNVGSDAISARLATDQICDDLKAATAITEQTSTAITMTVPDRDGDGSSETIRYSWSGTAGDPLYRTYNTRTAGIIATNIRALNFRYLSKTVGKPPPTTSAEQSIAYHATATSGNIASSTLSGTNGVAGCFKPTLTASSATATVTAWSVSRCQIMLRRDLVSTGTVTVSLRYADANNLPTGADLQTGTVAIVSILSSGLAWTDVSFSTTATLDPTKSVCLVVSYAALLGNGGYVGYDSVSTEPAMAYTTTSNNGTSWATASTSQALQFKAWGTITSQEAQTLDPQPLPPAAP